MEISSAPVGEVAGRAVETTNHAAVSASHLRCNQLEPFLRPNILIGSPWYHDTRPGKHTKNDGKSWNIYQFLTGKSMRNCHFFNSKLLNSKRVITMIAMIILPYTETSIIFHLSIIWLLKNPDCSMVESPLNFHSTIMFWWLMHRFSWLAIIWIPYGSV